MDYQLLFNFAFGGFCALASWLFKVVWVDLQAANAKNASLQIAQKDLELKVVQEYARKVDNEATMMRILEKVSRIETIELELVGQYVRKDEFTRALDNFSSKLDKIFDQLATKVDK